MQPLFESHPNNDSTLTWSELEPDLDTAIAELPGADRDAILLRFFDRKALKDVGLALGVSEEAAKKRVTRAVVKLRECLASRGHSLSLLALGGFLAELRIHAAPEGLSAAITGQAIGTVAPPAALELLVDGGVRDWFWQAAQRWIPIAACVTAMLVGTAVVWNHFSSDLPETVRSSGAVVEASAAGVPSPGANRTPIPSAKLASSALLVQVVDAFSGSPIAGVRTRIAFGGAAGNVPSEDRQTDATGVLQMEVHPDSFHTLSVRLASEGYVPVLLEWQDHEFVEPVLNYTCRLKRGQRVHGNVRDPSGAPVPNATVSLAGFWSHEPSMRENVGFQDSFTAIVTDAQGHFETAQVPNPLPPDGGLLVSVTHPEFIRSGIEVLTADALATNLQMVLKPGVRLSGRILDEQGDPVDGVTVTENHRFLGPRRSTQTDASGAFVLGPFAPRNIPIQLAAAGYKSFETLVALDAPVQVEWVLKRSSESPETVSDVHSTRVRLVGSVVDSDTGMPLPEFKITLSQVPQEDFRRLIGVGHDGRFGWEVRLDSDLPLRLRIEVDGYATLASEEYRPEAMTDPLEFRLHRVSQLRGRVLQPDGKPAAGAEVGVNGDGYGLSFESPGRLVNYGPIAPYTLTDPEGRFELPTTFLNPRMVLVVHSSGCVSVPVQSVTNALIQLEPWASIEGTLQIGGRSAANESVRIERLLLDAMAPPLGVGLNQTTDASGRFVFDRIPAGTYRVSRTLDPHPGQEGETGSSHSTRVNVTAGERTRVSLGTEGRPVVAHIQTSRGVPSLDWTQILPRLERAPMPPEPSVEAFPNPMAFQRAKALQYMSVDRHYGTVTTDGFFHADDVPPGEYVLIVTVFARSEEDGSLVPEGWPRGGILGTLKKPVTIPGAAGQRSEEPFDLGELEILIP